MKKKRSGPSAALKLRRGAEARLSERKHAAGPAPAAKEDIQRLVHELQVHQVELEMQNEELLRSRRELETLLNKYTDLYDFGPAGYFTLTRDGSILQINLVGAKLLGAERANLVNRRFGLFVSPQSRITFDAFLDKVFNRAHKETCEAAIQQGDAITHWLQIEAALDLKKRATCHAVAVDVTERKRIEEQLWYLSAHDALTGLYNRGFFMTEMARYERGDGFPLSIMMADVDDFKDTNDDYGHAAGDALLKRVAHALTTAFRAGDVIARIGGDEFAALLPRTNATEAAVLLQRVRKSIREGNAAPGAIPIEVSLSSSTATHPTPLAVVLDQADAKMYSEKQEQKLAKHFRRTKNRHVGSKAKKG